MDVPDYPVCSGFSAFRTTDQIVPYAKYRGKRKVGKLLLHPVEFFCPIIHKKCRVKLKAGIKQMPGNVELLQKQFVQLPVDKGKAIVFLKGQPENILMPGDGLGMYDHRQLRRKQRADHGDPCLYRL